jgi:hypothetical protein
MMPNFQLKLLELKRLSINRQCTHVKITAAEAVNIALAVFKLHRTQVATSPAELRVDNRWAYL